MNSKELSLYIHIPFCVKKCLYCDFLSFSADETVISAYFEALKREIIACSGQYRDNKIKSVFFGGGTPSFPDKRYICEALSAIKEGFDLEADAEISLELNPGTATYEKISAYRECGFNRLSIGAQSLNDAELQKLGRIHDSKTFYQTYENARRAGFDNINIDLMSAIPEQTCDSYMRTLEEALRLEPEHISAYSLIIEEGTPFCDMELDLVSEDDERRMYHDTKRILEQRGYSRYEISNYAKAGYECRHNKVYWQRGNYLGMGLGASSMVENVRWKNVDNMKDYVAFLRDADMEQNIRTEVTNLSQKDCMEEFMFLGLRLVEGVSIDKFRSEFGRDIHDVYGDVIDRYSKMGLLEEVYYRDGGNAGYLRLTENGMDVSNTVMADFLLD